MKSYVIGVDVGGTNIKLGAVHPCGKVIARTSFPTKPFASSKTKLISALAEQIEAIIVQAGLTKKNIGGIGIGLPGLVDHDKGIVRFLPNIPGWRNVHLRDILHQKLKLPIFIDNDVKLITLAEWKYGAGQGVSDMICLTLGTGVGSGLVLGGQLYRGLGNAAGELGHVPLNEQGPKCGCGGFGCLEAYIGNGRLLARANILFKRADITLEEMSAKAQAGNTKALRFWEEMGTHLGNGLAGVVNLLNPKRIVIGGGVSNNFQFISKAVAKVIARRAMTTQSSMVKVVRAALGNDAGIIGAQVLVRNAHA